MKALFGYVAPRGFRRKVATVSAMAVVGAAFFAGSAQACSYKLGQLKIRELRAKASAQLGSRFDERTFHDEILSGGSLPLDVLDARVTRWIEAQQTKTASR